MGNKITVNTKFKIDYKLSNAHKKRSIQSVTIPQWLEDIKFISKDNDALF